MSTTAASGKADSHPDARASHEEVLVLDFGGQYSQLIARRIRECGVFAELLPHDTAMERIRERRPAALVLSGGPASVYSEGAPELRRELLELDVPVLGICYGMQAMVHVLGGRVEGADAGEFGRTSLVLADGGGRLLSGLPHEQQCWMSHRDSVFEPPAGFVALASSPGSPVAALESPEQRPLRDPVPPRGRPHALRHADPRPLPARGRRPRAALVARLGDRRAGRSECAPRSAREA